MNIIPPGGGGGQDDTTMMMAVGACCVLLCCIVGVLWQQGTLCEWFPSTCAEEVTDDPEDDYSIAPNTDTPPGGGGGGGGDSPAGNGDTKKKKKKKKKSTTPCKTAKSNKAYPGLPQAMVIKKNVSRWQDCCKQCTSVKVPKPCAAWTWTKDKQCYLLEKTGTLASKSGARSGKLKG